ncbi:MAG: DUF1080 domain-containing protein, partial [Planctomycetaceae bacterium]|nr:DUF1080 domain-containing protein [Planctomycetaceae bacterium]
MKSISRSLTAILLLISLALGNSTNAEDINSLSDAENKQNFKLLFDGKTTNGWQHKGNWLVK